jgi:hypothetical protein
MTMLRMRTLLISLVLLGCGSDNKTTVDAAVTLDCTSYCSAIMTNCTGANAQYPDMAHCMGSCTAFPVGTLADRAVNTLGCRLYHAGAPSAATPATHCFHAGPGGAGADGTTSQCGADCDGFCNIMTSAACPGKYADLAACQTACAAFASAPPFHSAATGNNRQCRLYHATNAIATGAAPGNVHCDHASAAGNTAPCMQ